MTPKEKQAVQTQIRSIVANRHQCALRAPLHPGDKANGLKVGQLCDSCVEEIEGHMKQIKENSK